MKLKIVQHNRRPSLLDCVRRQKFLRIANESAVPSVMAAFEAAEAELAAAEKRKNAQTRVCDGVSAKQQEERGDEPILKRIIPVGVEAVDDDPETDDIETDRLPLDYVASAPVLVAGKDGDVNFDLDGESDAGESAADEGEDEVESENTESEAA
jgi:hypothetical protein